MDNTIIFDGQIYEKNSAYNKAVDAIAVNYKQGLAILKRDCFVKEIAKTVIIKDGNCVHVLWLDANNKAVFDYHTVIDLLNEIPQINELIIQQRLYQLTIKNVRR